MKVVVRGRQSILPANLFVISPRSVRRDAVSDIRSVGCPTLTWTRKRLATTLSRYFLRKLRPYFMSAHLKISMSSIVTSVRRTVFWISILTWIALASPVVAVEFRVDTRVFRSGESEPLAVHTTWLGEQRIYNQSQSNGAHSDPAAESNEVTTVTIFDLEKRTVILLDKERQLSTTLKFDEILEFIAATSTRTTALSRLVRFASAPKFEHEWDEEQGRIYLNHETMAYSAKLLSLPFDALESEEYARHYRAFTDWAARLNTMCPGLPPAARLKLNLAIYERHAVPKSVRRTIPDNKSVVLDAISRHEYQWQLSPDDQAQLATFDDWENSFRFIDYKQFLLPSSETADIEQ
jgi:hypothetical protein